MYDGKKQSIISSASPEKYFNCFCVFILVTFKILNNMHVGFLNVSNLCLAHCRPEMKDEDLINLFSHSLFSYFFSSLYLMYYHFYFIAYLSLITLNNILMPQCLNAAGSILSSHILGCKKD